MKTWTHAELVARAARWLKNSYGCKTVLTEQSSFTGETPDAIGWKSNGRSILVECKTSRSDFLADARKPFRENQLLGLGAERYYMVPAGESIIDIVHDLPLDWGLVEVNGRGCKVVVPCRPRKDLRSDQARNYEMRVLVETLSRVTLRLEPAQLNEWLQYEHRNTSLTQMQAWVSKEDHETFLLASQGWVPVVDPLDLTVDEGLQEPWCPKHDQLFADCACVGPGEAHVEYREIDGKMMARPMAVHAGKFPPCENSELGRSQVGLGLPGPPDLSWLLDVKPQSQV